MRLLRLSPRLSAPQRQLLLAMAVFFATLTATFAVNKKKVKRPTPPVPLTAMDNALHEASTLYGSRVRPLLQGQCMHCHGPQRQKGGLRVDTVAAMLKGGDSGPAIVPGKSSQSPLIARILADEMPRGAPPLQKEEIAVLRQWIDRGAFAPPGEKPQGKNDLWAFQPLRLPPVPRVSPALGKNPIDAFVEAGRQKAGLAWHNPPADRRLLLRRVAMDLTGLPPTAKDYQEFLNDPSPRAYEKAVDRLLDSPRYGERWARHWMDILRYSSHDGRYAAPLPDGRKFFKEVLYSNEYIWRWRDYLIQAIQTDKSFNRIILEMLAGDELAPEDPRALAATGYLVRNFNNRDRDLWLTHTVDHTSQAFLGLSLGCARCHDHKFDPISQKDYYQFRAFFEPHEVESRVNEKLAYARDSDTRPTYLYIRGNPKAPDKTKTIEPQVPEVLGKIADLKPVDLHVHGQPWQSSGRRLALAKWLVGDDNPLVARVIVNHVWLRHFGRGLVDTATEFGARAQPPSHPELLDYLAVQFRNQRWSMKWLHRLIVTSNTYRMSSSNRNMSACLKADPRNRLYWRGPARRAEAEVVRDAILHLAGNLDNRVGGPDDDHAAADRSGRRSLYLRNSRVDQAQFLGIFDAPRVEECYQRAESIVPQQGLALLNSEFVWRNAARIANPMRGRADFIKCAFEHILAREPSPEEAALCRRFLSEQEELLRSSGQPDPSRQAQTYLVHSLLNHNDFITIR